MATCMFTSGRPAIWWAVVVGLFGAVMIPYCSSKTYDRCELAHDLLYKYKFPAKQISQWICLVRWESEFNTSAIGSLNADGSLDHGLFQISDLYWCTGPGLGEACGISCDALRDDDIKDDVICAKRIFRQHERLTGNGFNAWVAWRIHCQGDTDSYTADCPTSEHQPPSTQHAEQNSSSNNKSTTTGSKPPTDHDRRQFSAEAQQQHSSKWPWFTQLLPTSFTWFIL